MASLLNWLRELPHKLWDQLLHGSLLGLLGWLAVWILSYLLSLNPLVLTLVTVLSMAGALGLYIFQDYRRWRDLILSDKELLPSAVTAESTLPNERDTLNRVVIDGHRALTLDIDRQDNGWPIMFPILVRNSRPMHLQLTGFEVAVYASSTRVHRIGWPSSPGANVTSNGGAITVLGESGQTIGVHGTVPIPGDSYRIIYIPICVAQVQPKPPLSPEWRVAGNLKLQCGQQQAVVEVPDYHFRPVIFQQQWEDIVKHVQPPAYYS